MNFISPFRQRFPFGGILGSAIVGMLLAFFLGGTIWLVASLLGFWLLLLLFRLSESHSWVLTAAAFSLLQLWSWSEAPSRKLALWLDAHPGDFLVTGVISAEPKFSPTGDATFPMRLESMSPLGDGSGTITVPVTVLVRWDGERPSYGDLVSFHGEPERPPDPRNPGSMDYRGWLEHQGIFTEFRINPSEPGKIVSHGHGNPLLSWAITARHRMERVLETDLGSSPDVVSAIKGITLGVTDNAPQGFTDDFRFTGTMHLFSVSGLHVGMLAVIVWFTLRAFRIPRSWAVFCTIPLLFFYVAVTGLKMGSIRSATMASVLLLGLVLFRRSPMLNTLAFAAFLQLAVDPDALFSLGWQFSYTVVFAILVAAGPIEQWVGSWYVPDPFIPPKLLTYRERFAFDSWKRLAGLAAVSAAAWVGSLIPTIVYFHLISFSALGANMLAVPLAFGVLVLGVLSLMAGTFSLWVAGAFNNANWLITKLLLLVVQMSALIPGGHWFIGPPGKAYPEMTILDLRGSSCAVIRCGREFALVDAGRKHDASTTILPCLESSGANSLQSVLITKSDAAHLGGLVVIKPELGIKRLAVPPAEGRSPVAKQIFGSMHALTRLHAGESWPLLTGVTAEILDPQPGVPSDCLIVRIQLEGIRSMRVLMLPRLDPPVVSRLAQIPSDSLKADVAIIPLGGSELGTALEIIRRIAPHVVISTVDGLNRNGYPSSEWRGLLAAEGITLMRQDETGAVTLDADPKGPRVTPFLQRACPVFLQGDPEITGVSPKKPSID